VVRSADRQIDDALGRSSRLSLERHLITSGRPVVSDFIGGIGPLLGPDFALITVNDATGVQSGNLRGAIP
jgi:hypothetical protein